MMTDPSRIAEAIDNPQFKAGDEIVMGEGPHKYERGTFVALRPDVEWATIEGSRGQITSHPVEWMRNYVGTK